MKASNGNQTNIYETSPEVIYFRTLCLFINKERSVKHTLFVVCFSVANKCALFR